ncbi:MAG TPA: gamma-glutamylcyclotransferase family protein [Vicinamibacterales bacterium]|nr:gamma-glutamylcyclotransferase family protein [Vicinamibacterales bacterium]
MTDLVFFYGTLMTGFDRRHRAGIDEHLADFVGRGTISAELFDLGIYPAAVPAPEGHVWGEVYRMKDADKALSGLDEIEGYRPDDPDRSLYVREKVDVKLTDGRTEQAWVYFYNAPLGRAERIPSGDYLAHIKVR